MLGTKTNFFLISNFRRVTNVVFFFYFFFGGGVIPPTSEFLRMLYAFFWVILRRLNFICRRFGTLCLFRLHGWWCKWGEFLLTSPMKMEQSVPKRRHIQFRRWGMTQKNEYNKTEFTAHHRQLRDRLWIRQHFDKFHLPNKLLVT